MTADLSHIDTWLFDLDNTLYPAECELMGRVEARMTEFVRQHMGLPHDEARALQKRYYHEHGTTLAGLMAYDGVAPEDFLEFVHDVELDCLNADLRLTEALSRLPGRRLVFTNGSARHAERVLDRLGFAHLFEDVFHIASADYVPKPAAATYDRVIRDHGVTASSAAFFEDSEKNLKPAAQLGMATVLVGAHAAASAADFVHHRTDDLAGFLSAARLMETAA